MRRDVVEEAFRNREAPEVLKAVQQPVGVGRVAARLELPEPHDVIRRYDAGDRPAVDHRGTAAQGLEVDLALDQGRRNGSEPGAQDESLQCISARIVSVSWILPGYVKREPASRFRRYPLSGKRRRRPPVGQDGRRPWRRRARPAAPAPHGRPWTLPCVPGAAVTARAPAAERARHTETDVVVAVSDSRSCCGSPSGGSSGCCSRNRHATRADRGRPSLRVGVRATARNTLPRKIARRGSPHSGAPATPCIPPPRVHRTGGWRNARSAGR